MTANEFHNLALTLDLPPFLHPEYLDIICGKGNWGYVMYREGTHHAIWYYWLKKKWTIPYIPMPALAKYMGPYFSKNMSTKDKKQCIHFCVKQLPKHHYIYQQLSPKVLSSTEVFQESFEVSTGKTHILDLSASEYVLLQQMRGNNRRSINKYQENIEVSTNEIDGLYDIIITSLPDSSMLGIHREDFEQLCRVVIEKEIGFTSMIRHQGEIIAGSICLIFNKQAYYLLNGNKRLPGSIYPGVQIIWKVIQHLKSMDIESLDLLGSSIESIAKIWTSIGAIPTDYPIIEKKSVLYKNMEKLKRV